VRKLASAGWDAQRAGGGRPHNCSTPREPSEQPPTTEHAFAPVSAPFEAASAGLAGSYTLWAVNYCSTPSRATRTWRGPAWADEVELATRASDC